MSAADAAAVSLFDALCPRLEALLDAARSAAEQTELRLRLVEQRSMVSSYSTSLHVHTAVYEMWNPQRKIATQMGGEHSAKVPTATLLDRRTGKRQVVPARLAESKARKAGLVEAPRWKGRRVMFSDAAGRLWRLVGTEYVEA